MAAEQQGEFVFGAQGSDGYSGWVESRRVAAELLAAKLGLPLGRNVELWLRGGIRLRGKLRLENEILFVEESRLRDLPLVLDGLTFRAAEIESWVRVD